jgi:hypothetical protein
MDSTGRTEAIKKMITHTYTDYVELAKREIPQLVKTDLRVTRKLVEEQHNAVCVMQGIFDKQRKDQVLDRGDSLMRSDLRGGAFVVRYQCIAKDL